MTCWILYFHSCTTEDSFMALSYQSPPLALGFELHACLCLDSHICVLTQCWLQTIDPGGLRWRKLHLLCALLLSSLPGVCVCLLCGAFENNCHSARSIGLLIDDVLSFLQSMWWHLFPWVSLGLLGHADSPVLKGLFVLLALQWTSHLSFPPLFKVYWVF